MRQVIFNLNAKAYHASEEAINDLLVPVPRVRSLVLLVRNRRRMRRV